MEKTVDPKPFARFEWMVATRYLQARRKETFISVIAGLSFVGILLGVATLIVVMAVMNGFRTELLDRILGINGHFIVVPMDGDSFQDFDVVATRIKGVEKVTHVIPFIEGQVLAKGAQGRTPTGVLVRGLRGKEILEIDAIKDNVRLGTFDGFDEGQRVAIGSGLAVKLGLTVGDKVTLIAPEGNVTAFGVTPRVKAYEIAAIFQIGMSEYDASLAIMPLSEAQLYFNKESRVDALEIITEDPDLVDVLRPSIEEAIDRTSLVSDWRSRNRSFFQALELERDVMFFILTMIILVAALNIISGITMLVKDKGRDIAILRTMGASSGSILRIFLITGAAIGILGTIFGVVLGIIVARNVELIRQAISELSGRKIFDESIYQLSELPSKIEPGEVLSVVVMSLILTFLATIYPAWRAARLDPVEALRYE